MNEHDAIVIGAGVAGGAMAILLARQGRRVAVIERSAFPRRKVCGEFMSATSVPVLEGLGVADAWRERAGPEVRRVSLYAGERVIDAPMPRAGAEPHGRALGRDVLDGLLLDRARREGADVHQPAKAVAMVRENGHHRIDVIEDGDTRSLHAPIVIAAHGSWEPGPLATQSPKRNRPDDLLGFKAHFTGARLAPDRMPLLAFPGGYGGMVWADGGRLSVSCCIRRDRLSAIRAETGLAAGEAMHHHLIRSMRGAREALEGAELHGPWLAIGAVRPGIRPRYAADVFRIGNVAGESHSIIAEGQSMAIQSAWMLAHALRGIDPRSEADRAKAGARYARAWHRQFATRIHAAAAFSALATRAERLMPLAGVIERVPATLTFGARLSGKTKPVAA